ncbi:DUF4493 domain-containing protein [uncultured Bacteroides sp.]|uniref:DUF4493 domain-containing protein n=1 Tax=uncultured Bacteroides sp. TaxID=162156 RepID=UPI0026069308|nr:DUF4493 domain-containing protein [uncultured Bacteroides sp.]
MKKQIVCIYFLIGLLLLVSCKNQGNLLFDEGRGEIRFSLVDTTEVEITTRASLNLDVNEFNVSLSRGETPIFTDRKYKDIAGTTISCSAGPNYLLKAENCTEAEAESKNNNWGQARVYGEESFTVVANETNTVTVNCGLANSSVSVDFSDYIVSSFDNYSIDIYATDASSRTFKFDETNYKFKTAYFNVNGTRELSYTVTLPSPYQPYTDTFSMEPSKSYKFSVKIDGDSTNSTVTLGIIVDGTLSEEVILTESINPYA